MKIAIGLCLVIAGIVMLVFGVNASQSFASDVSRFFTGNPTDRSVWLLIGGVVAVIAGLVVGVTPALKRR